MRFSHFFIDRPIFATVLAIFITLIGARRLLHACRSRSIRRSRRRPSRSPPAIPAPRPRSSPRPSRRRSSSRSTASRTCSTCRQPGDRRRQADDHRHVRARHRPRHRAGADAEPRRDRRCRGCPRRCSGSASRCSKNSPDMLMVVHLISPDGSRDQLYISNYATLHVKDVLARAHGVGDVQIFGARDYAMRIWLDPDKVAAHDLTAGEVVARAAGAERAGLGRRAQPAAGAAAPAPSSSTSRRSAG